MPLLSWLTYMLVKLMATVQVSKLLPKAGSAIPMSNGHPPGRNQSRHFCSFLHYSAHKTFIYE
ncbi:MAG: hypothetical protein CMQ45_08350 [Gammaproteobacteria bacterium]|nr:hypothetical protein [Gammaproteobacteria bacterium]